MRIDVRKENNYIDEIIFSDLFKIVDTNEKKIILECTTDSEINIAIEKNSVDNLIKALELSKKLFIG